jgi:hypothetical protein
MFYHIVVIDMLDFNNSTWWLICNRILSYDMSVVVLKANISQWENVLYCNCIIINIDKLSYCQFIEPIGGVMFSVLASSAVDRGVEAQSGQTKDYKIGICCFSAKHAVLRRESQDWLARNQDNVSEWGDTSIRRLLFQWACTMKIQLSVLV